MGQSTAEASTNISRLLEELGDSGSKVATTLKEKTGKSFTELMQGGESLYDVLSVLDGVAKENGENISSMFGSSNAGIGALAILSEEGMMYNDVLKEVAGSSGLLDEGFNKMAETSEFKLSASINELKNSLIDVGGAFAPIISAFASFTSSFASFVNGLGGGTKTAIGYIAGFTALLSPLALGLSGLAKTLGGLKIFDKLALNDLGTNKLKDFVKQTEKPIEMEVLEPSVVGVKDFGDKGRKRQQAEIKMQQEAIKQQKELIYLQETSRKAVVNDIGMGATTKSFKEMGGVLAYTKSMLLPLAAGMVALGVATWGANKINDAFIKSQSQSSRIYESASKGVEEHKEKIEELGNQEKTLTKLTNRYEELSKKTNRTKEENEELKGILEEVAEIDPNLVEYDKNGDPISLKLDLVKDLIEELKRAKKEQELLLRGDLKARAESSKGKYDDGKQDRQVEYGKTEAEVRKLAPEVVRNDTSWLKEYNKGDKEALAERQEVLDNIKKAFKVEQDFIAKDVEDRKNISKDRADYLDTIEIEKKGKDRQTALQNALKLDMSEIDDGSITAYKQKIDDFLNTASYENIGLFNDLTEQNKNLNKSMDEGSISQAEYNRQIEKQAQTLSELTGMDVETARQVLTSPEFDSESLYQTLGDIDEAKVQIEEKIMGMSQLEPEGRIEMAYSILNDPQTPTKIKDAIADILEDGEITDQELEILAEINGELEEGDLLDTINEELDKLSEEKKITKKVAVKYAMKVKNGNDLNQYIKELTGDEEFTISVMTQINSGDLEGFKSSLETLPQEKQIGIMSAIIQSGQYDIATLNSLLAMLPPEVQTQVRAISNFGDVLSGKEKLKEPVESTVNMKANDIEVKQAKASASIGTKSTHDFNANDTSVINAKRKAQQNTSSTHTITIFQKVGNFIGNLFKGGGTQSLGDPQIVEIQSQLAPIDSASVQSVQSTISSMSNQISTFNDSNKSIITPRASKPKKTSPISYNQTFDAIKYSIDLLENAKNRAEKLGEEFDRLGARIERAFGSNKSKLIKQQISLLEQEQAQIKYTYERLQSQANNLKKSLGKKGFKFTSTGAIDNYNSKIIAMEKNVEKLKKKEESYKGKNEKTKDKLSKAYEKANEELQLTKDTLSEYYDLSFKEIPGLKTEWESLANEIIEAKNAIYEANKEQANFYEDAKATELEYQYSKIADSMDILNSKMDLASDNEKIDLLKEQLKLIEQQKAKQTEMANNNKSEQKYFKDFLGKKGFKFDKSGEMTNGVGQLDKYKSDDEYESIKDAYDNYLELQQAIRDTDKETWELKVTEKELKDQIEEIIREQEELNKQMGEMKNQAKIDSIIAQNEALSNSLELVEAKMENAYGKDKAKYLEEQIRLLEEQRKKQKELADEYERQANVSKDGLGKDFGITFNDDGSIQNYADAMSKLTNIEDMEKLKDAVDKYLELQNDGLSDAQQEYENLGNEIQNAKDEILELANAMKEMKDEATTNQLQSQIDKIQNLIDMNEAKEGLNDSDKNQSLKDRLELYKKLQEETQKMLDYENSKKKDMVDTLNEYGFKINDDGTINDTANKLESLKNSMSESEFDFISETLEKYLETAFGSIPDLEKDLIESQKKMEDIQKEKLDATKKVEDEITKVYEKQKQDRIKKIEEEKDARIKALNESKDAYNKFRDKEKYEDSHKEQLDKVNKLQSDIENAKRDTSLSGKKRLEDLMKQLADEQKNLENMVKDELDKNINDMFDDQIKDTEDETEDEIKKLEDLWSSSNISNAIKEALETNIFTDIDGNISALDDALMDFANSSEDYLGVMGDSLRDELSSNLEIALDYMNKLKDTSLDLSNIDFSNLSNIDLKEVDYNSNRYSANAIAERGNTNNINNVIKVDFSPRYEIESGANIDESALKGMLMSSKDEIVGEIQNAVLKNIKY